MYQSICKEQYQRNDQYGCNDDHIPYTVCSRIVLFFRYSRHYPPGLISHFQRSVEPEYNVSRSGSGSDYKLLAFIKACLYLLMCIFIYDFPKALTDILGICRVEDILIFIDYITEK